MRRKTKQLLATGMALAVLATNLTPLSLAAETAAEMQTGEAATQALSDEIAVQAYYHKNHVYGDKVEEGFRVINTETGEAEPYVVAKCITPGKCDTPQVTRHGDNVMPSSVTEATCTSNKVFHYSGTSFTHGGYWTVDSKDVTILNSTVDHKYTNYVSNNDATCTKNGTKTAKCDYGCGKTSTIEDEGSKLEHSYAPDGANIWTWTVDENGATATVSLKCTNTNCDHVEDPVAAKVTEKRTPATCTADGSLAYTAVATIDGQTFENTYNKDTFPKLGHDYSVDFAWTDNTDGTATAKATIKCSKGDVEETKDATVTKESTSVAPGCLTPGKNVYTASVTTDDGKTFTSKTHEVTAPATDHSYGNSCSAQWDDNTYKTATLIWECDNEGCDPNSEGHFKSETLTAEEKVTKPATCTDKGRLLHEVSYEFGGETEYLRQTTTIPALGHDFTKLDNDHVTFTFSEDGKSATATIQCSRCDETKPADANAVKVTSKVTTKPRCTTVGTTTYTAELGDASATTTRNDVEPIGHFYIPDSDQQIEWNEEDKTATLYYKCMDCGDKQHETVQLVKDDKNSELPTCTKDGYDTYVATGAFTGVTEKDNVATVLVSHPFKVNKLGHDCELTLEWDDDTYTSATATVKCSDCDYERDVPVTITAERTEPTCTGNGYVDYTATADVTYDPETEGRSPEKDRAQIYGQTILPATGHHYGAYHCTNNGTEVATCDYCGATTARAATGSAVCDAHTVDGASVCAVCGKVNGSALLPQITASSNANTMAVTADAQLVVRAGTLPSGQKILTVAYLDANGKVLNLTGSWKVRVPLAELQAQLGTTEGNGFEHTLTLLAPNGEKKAVGFAVENGTVIFDATFNNSTACILLVD